MDHSITTGYFTIAPCGMNCSVCMAYQRDRNVCPGCRSNDEHNPNYCNRCIIRNCDLLKETTSKFCYECTQFPCKRLKQLDNRYKLKYHMSMIENLNMIKDKGLDIFILKEVERWKCPACGGNICVHRGYCLKCKTALSNYYL